jgi:hypothetical protein
MMTIFGRESAVFNAYKSDYTFVDRLIRVLALAQIPVWASSDLMRFVLPIISQLLS